MRHILQQPGFRLHHVPVAEEDEPPEVAPVFPLHILNDIVTTQGTVVLVLNSPDPNVPAHRQEGHLKEETEMWQKHQLNSQACDVIHLLCDTLLCYELEAKDSTAPKACRSTPVPFWAFGERSRGVFHFRNWDEERSPTTRDPHLALPMSKHMDSHSAGQ